MYLVSNFSQERFGEREYPLRQHLIQPSGQIYFACLDNDIVMVRIR